MFGGIFAGLLLVGFAFGVWAGAPPARPKPTESADAKKEADKPAPKAAVPVAPAPVSPVKKDDPEKVKEPEPEPKKPEPEPKPKPPEPKPKVKEPEPKKPDRVVAFKDVAPLLKANCNECHGDAKGKPKGDVDTRTLAGILKSKGPPVVAGKPLDSTLYTSVKGDEMPPDPKKKLTDVEKQLLHDWIAGGAKERRAVRRRKLELTTVAGLG